MLYHGKDRFDVYNSDYIYATERVLWSVTKIMIHKDRISRQNRCFAVYHEYTKLKLPTIVAEHDRYQFHEKISVSSHIERPADPQL